jgi:hypothetical protein
MKNIATHPTGRLNFTKGLCCALLVSILCACSPQETFPSPDYLDIDRPFGISWNPNQEGLDELATLANAHCEIWLDKAENDLSRDSNTPQEFLTECLSESDYRMYLSFPEATKEFFDDPDDALSVAAIKPAVPLVISYHFNHTISWLPEEIKSQKDRAKILRKDLTRRYGKPASRGHFTEWGKSNYTKSIMPNAPCQFWVEKSVGIFLCSERVIYVDGLEMSLEFVRLDRLPNGKALFNEIAPSFHSRPEHADILSQEYVVQVPVEPTMQELEFADLISGEWLSSLKFSNCETEGLLPLQRKIEEIQDLAEIYSDITSANSGQKLANFVYEDSPSLEDRVPSDRRLDAQFFFLSTAAETEGTDADNELGNSQLYCDFGVQQNLEGARQLFTQAVKIGSPHAMWNLAKMHLAGLTPSETPRDDAKTLLKTCDKAGLEDCGALLTYIEAQE